MNAVNAPPAIRDWLISGGSLTARLKTHCQVFRVQRLHQHSALCLRDEAAAIGGVTASVRPLRVRERAVLLLCDERAIVFAHTVMPLTATASDWPQFDGLGERSLGSTLFGDPQVRRGALEFARLRATHPLAVRARAALALGPGADTADADTDSGAVAGEVAGETASAILYARRCVYTRKRGSLLVTEVFLPAVADLARSAMADRVDTDATVDAVNTVNEANTTETINTLPASTLATWR